MNTKQTFLLDLGRIVLGLAVFALGVHLTIFANIGLAPWDCLGMGIAKHTPLNYGMAMTAVSVTILVVDLLLRERIGFGTAIDALLTGNLIQLYNDCNPWPLNTSLPLGVVLLTAGMAVMAVGMWIYMLPGRGCGPRDALLVGLGKLVRCVPIGAVQMALLITVVAVGWLLGGPVGPGTLLFMALFGPEMQLIYHWIGFEPRDVRHRSAGEDLAMLLRKD